MQKKSKDENESKIKKIIIAIILFIIVLVLLFFVFRTPKYDIVLDSNGGTEISSFVVKKDGKITEPDDPVRDGYSFKGWYYNDKLYDFSKPVTKDIGLEARWEKIEKIESVKFEQDKLNLNTGDTDSLEVVITPNDATDIELKWSSSDASIVSVDENGKVTALKAGSATITVATDDGKYTATINPGDATDKSVTWTSSDSSVATVDADRL